MKKKKRNYTRTIDLLFLLVLLIAILYAFNNIISSQLLPQRWLLLAAAAAVLVNLLSAALTATLAAFILLRLEGREGGRIEVGASSPGGGRIRVFQVDGLHTSFSGELPTLVVHNTDQPGCVSQVTGVLAGRGLNVATLQLNRGGRGGSAVMVIECDQPIPTQAAREIRGLPGILRVTCYAPEEEERT